MGPPRTDRPTNGGATSAEKLIRLAHALLTASNIPLSPSKVSCLVREYKHKVEPRGIPFENYLDSAVDEIKAKLTRDAAGQFLTPEDKSGRSTLYSDHAVGEPATWNVFVDCDLPRLIAARDGST